MLDSNALADLIAELVGDYVERATAPLIERIAELEARSPFAAVEARIDEIERGLPALIATSAAPLVDERFASLPAPVNGRDADPDVIRQMVQAAVAEIPLPKDGSPGADGKDADMAVVAAMVEEAVGKAVSALPPAEPGAPGRDVDMDVVSGMVADQVREAISALPPAQDGKDGVDGANGRDVEDIQVIQNGSIVEFAFTVGETRSIFEIELPAGPAGADGKDGDTGERGPDGRVGKITKWTDAVHYENDIVTHAGSVYQALRDTGHAPPHDDWLLIVSAGTDGAAGRSLNPSGTYQPDAVYRQLDIVMLNGSSFVALADEPGSCPGEGWQLLAGVGKRGQQGERGSPGARGDAGQPVVAAEVTSEGALVLVNGDGSTVTADFYPVLSRIDR